MSLGFLLPVYFSFCVSSLLRRFFSPTLNGGERVLVTAIILGLVIAFSTELLSAFHALTTFSLMLFWGLACLAGTLAQVFAPVCPRGITRSDPVNYFLNADATSKLMAVVIYVFVTTTGLIAFLAIPNTWDGMTYLLPRMAHWHQNHSIAFYATNNVRQNEMPPFAEWCILQLTLLQGNDGLANFVQWLSYVGCILAASVIAGRLGGDSRGGLVAAFFTATLPLAILESTNTECDIVASFWLICALGGCVKLSLRPGWDGVLIFASSLGLAILTKTICIFYALPLSVWAFIALMRHGDSFKRVSGRLALIALLVMGLNAGHMTRNLVTSQSPFGPDSIPKSGVHLYTNDIHTPGAILSNILRNMNLHLPLLDDGMSFKRLVFKIDHLLGIDPMDPRTTFAFHADYFIKIDAEDGSPMQIHFAFIGLALMILLLYCRPLTSAYHILALCVVAGALLVCAILKWSPWNSRMHFPLFVLAAPLIVPIIQRPAWKKLLFPTLFLISLGTACFVFRNPVRPAIGGRHALFHPPSLSGRFLAQPELKRPYETTTRILAANHVKTVGLISDLDSEEWEYPLFHQPDLSRWRIDHVLVESIYAPLENTNAPDALVSTKPDLPKTLEVHGRRYRLAFIENRGWKETFGLSIYFPEGVSLTQP